MECAACGTPLVPGYVACPACGMAASAPADDAAGAVKEVPPGDAAATDARDASDDRPTETMPAVLLPDPASEPAPPADPVALAPPLPPPVAAAPPARRRRDGRRDVIVGGLIGVLGALTLIVGVIVLGNMRALGGPDAVGGENGPPARTGASPASAEVTAQPRPAAGGLSCEPQRIAAPGGGRWVFHRANYASRGGRDSFVVLLRREGDADDAAAVHAELVAPAEVPARFGLDAPADASAALVLVLEGPVAIAGPFGDAPGYRALQRFNVVRDGDGTVHAVLGLRSSACFAVSAPDWQAGEMPPSTEITVDIDNR